MLYPPLACSVCAMEKTVDFMPFLVVWAFVCVVWVCYSAQAKNIAPRHVACLALAMTLVLFLPFWPLMIALGIFWCIAGMARVAWRGLRGTRDTKTVIAGALLVIALTAVPLSLWTWYRPDVLVLRLGSGRMAPLAKTAIYQLQACGYDMVPRLVAVLEDRSDERYWLQANKTWQKMEALEVLTELRDPRGVPAACALLGSPGTSSILRKPLTRYLGQSGGDAAVAALARFAEAESGGGDTINVVKATTDQNFGTGREARMPRVR